jgi:anti-sigma regulatory factor (Ser/Thr protein kinase)
MMQSTATPAPLELTLEAVPRSVPKARTAAAEFARQVGADADDVELAVAEATSNAIVHGFTAGPPGQVDVRGELQADELTVIVADNGQGIRPHPDGGGLGLGLALIGQLASSFTVSRRRGGGTEMRMTFELAGGA